MLHHATRRTDITSAPLFSILQAAAGRAWVRTRPARSFHHTVPTKSTVAFPRLERKDGESSTGVIAQWAAGFRSPLEAAARLENTPPPANPNLYDDFEPQDWLESEEFYVDDVPPVASSAGPAPVVDPKPEDVPHAISVTEVEEPATRSATAVAKESCVVTDPLLVNVARSPRKDAVEAHREYEDDPPWDGPRWDEILDELEEAGDAPTIAIACTDPTIRVAKAPTSRTGLYHHLIYLAHPKSAGSTRPLSLLLRYHNVYSHLQSTASFNYLISIAIGTGQFDIASGLLDEMVERGFGNMETRVLRARLLIRRGYWEQAWKDESASGSVPLPIWLEFLGTSHHNIPPMLDAEAAEERSRFLARMRALRASLEAEKTDATAAPLPSSEPRPDDVDSRPDVGVVSPDASTLSFQALNASYGDWDSSPSMPRVAEGTFFHPTLGAVSTSVAEAPAAEAPPDNLLWRRRDRVDDIDEVVLRPRKQLEPPPPEMAVEQARFDTLMRHPPALTPEQSARMPPRVTLMLVKWYMRTNNPRAAFDATESYFKTLPPQLSPALRRACMNIVHAQLVSSKPHLSGHYLARRTLAKLLRLHPDLAPDSTTLLYLINSLRTVAHCGTAAMGLVEEFRRRYGADVVDERVRWRLAWLALKERNLRHAERVFKEHDAERARQDGVDLMREVSGQQRPAGTPERPPFHRILPARELDEYWIPLRKRLEQLRVRKQEKKKAGTSGGGTVHVSSRDVGTEST